MAEINTTGISSVNPLEIYRRGEKSDRENPTNSSDTRHPSEQESSESSSKDKVTLSREAQKISELAVIDRKVRTHEAAHAAAGGQYAGGPSFSYQQGPDGKRYAVAGEVPIDLSPVSGDPEATIKKAQIVRAAAQAPADPSAQDRQVAAAATRMELQARTEIQTQKREESGEGRQLPDLDDNRENTSATSGTETSKPSLNLYA